MFGIFGRKKEAAPPAAMPAAIAKNEKAAYPPGITRAMKEVNIALGEYHIYVDYFIEMFDATAEAAWGFPASEAHHHIGEHGLLEHSLSVTTRMINKIGTVFTAAKKPEGVSYKEWMEKVKIYSCLAGLSHDLGKIMEWRIDTGGFDYNPAVHSLRNFDHPYKLVSKKAGTFHTNSTSLSVMLLYRVLCHCPNFLNSQHYSSQEIALVADAIMYHHSKEMKDNLYWELLVLADQEDAKAEKEAFMSAPVAPVASPQIIDESNNAPTVSPVVETPQLQFEQEAADVAIVTTAVKVIRDMLPSLTYTRGYWVTDNGWMLLLAPKHTVDKKTGAVSLLAGLKRVTGREIDEVALYEELIKAGVMIKLHESNYQYNLHFMGTHGKPVTTLTHIVLDVSKILSPEEIMSRGKFIVTNLDDVKNGISTIEEKPAAVVVETSIDPVKADVAPEPEQEPVAVEKEPQEEPVLEEMLSMGEDNPDDPDAAPLCETEDALTLSSAPQGFINPFGDGPAATPAGFINPFGDGPSGSSPGEMDSFSENDDDGNEDDASEPEMLEDPVLDDFFKQYVKVRLDNTCSRLVKSILNVLATEPIASSEGVDLTEQQKEALGRISTLKHSVLVAQYAVDGLTGPAYRNALIAALAHDLGALPSSREKHPGVSIPTASAEAFLEIAGGISGEWISAVAEAIRTEKAAKSPLAKQLMAAHVRARQTETSEATKS